MAFINYKLCHARLPGNLTAVHYSKNEKYIAGILFTGTPVTHQGKRQSRTRSTLDLSKTLQSSEIASSKPR